MEGGRKREGGGGRGEGEGEEREGRKGITSKNIRTVFVAIRVQIIEKLLAGEQQKHTKKIQAYTCTYIFIR